MTKFLVFALIVFVGLAIAQAIIIVKLKSKEKLDPEKLATLYGAGNAFITKKEAFEMRHNFDRFHRHPALYNNSGQVIPIAGISTHTPIDADDNAPNINTENGSTDPRLNGKLSTLVWFDKDVIKYLSDLLQDPKFGLNGVNIYFGAYNTTMHNTTIHQKYDQQATLFFVPTKINQKGIRENDFTVVNKYFLSLLDGSKKEALLLKKFQDGALNHGDLCPTNCPPGEN